MANREHVALLQQSVKAWNRWRGNHQDISPDLNNANLSGAKLCYADLSGAKLWDADLSDTDLRGAKLSYAYLWGANLRGTNLSHADLRGATLRGADLSDADLSDADLSDAYLPGANLSDATLWSANLRGAKLWSADLTRADLGDAVLTRADLTRAVLIRAVLTRAVLTRATLSDADLGDADLSGADLSGTTLTRADLSGADLGGADLNDADLSGADLNDADLSGATLSGATLSGATLRSTVFVKVDLCTTQGLVQIYHAGPSIIELHSIHLPQDGSALHFLHGVGIPDAWIDVYQTIMMHPVQYYSCFLSYSSTDNLIVQRLHADLQAHGVRCWFAPHDLKPGNYVRKEIDQAIHLQDKLLLILSESAIKSGWVEHEVELALVREMRQQREILFPIRLDNEVLQSTSHWATTLQATRHIGDFTNWTDPHTYQQTFDRLLRDLKKADA